MCRKCMFAVIGVFAAVSFAGAADTDALVGEGKALLKEYGDALREELTAAVKEKGPVHAISVCNLKAPEIAGSITEKSGWFIGRSSHKLRNPSNKADAFTAAALEDFLKRAEAGEKPEDMVKASVVEENGKQVFHLVKAIPTGELCVNCHGGAEVKPEVEAKLAELYPKDEARGFMVGSLRGVFTLSKTLD